jgi:hypothetical protein
MTIFSMTAQAYSQGALPLQWTVITIAATFAVVLSLEWWVDRRYPKIEAPKS